MKEIVSTNDAVLISFIESLLRGADIPYFVFDRNMSILDGSLGVLPRRVMIKQQDEAHVRRLFQENGIEHELRK